MEVFVTASPESGRRCEPGVWMTGHRCSRTLEFEDVFMAVTEAAESTGPQFAGREFVDASLRLLLRAALRRLGKTHPGSAGSHPLCGGRMGVHLGRGPDRLQEDVQSPRELFDRSLGPLPVATWDVRWAPDAFRYLNQAATSARSS